MKPAITILVCVLAAGLALAQSPSIIQNTRATMNAVRDNVAAASNAALASQDRAPSAAAATHGPVRTGAGTPISAQRPAVAGKAEAARPVRVPAAHPRVHAKAAPVTPKENKPEAAAAPSGAPVAGPAAAGPAGDEGAATDNKWNANGKRDPFVSPVVSHTDASGCNSGKKCLEIATINLRGIVHSESGFIAVVSNGLNKAYFLRENDPVFNGYVMKITGDSIVFQETLQDRLGKTFTREVVKKITTPAV